MNSDNPYIDGAGDSLNPLGSTVCNVLQSLAIFEELFYSNNAEPTEISYDAGVGYLLMLKGMTGALGQVLNELGDYERKPTPDPANVSQLAPGD